MHAMEDVDTAARYFKKALDLVRASNEVGDSQEAAFNCFLKAAELGHQEAVFAVAMSYESGRGVEPSKTAYIEWLRRCIQFPEPSPEALHKWADLFASREPQKAMHYLRLAYAGGRHLAGMDLVVVMQQRPTTESQRREIHGILLDLMAHDITGAEQLLARLRRRYGELQLQA